MRKLVYVRIVHTSEDMGSLSKKLQEEIISRIGRDKWEENQKKILKFWEELEKEILGLKLDLEHTKIYQDGLPAEGEIGMKIVYTAAKLGSQNYRLIEKLVEKGAQIVATESPELLIEERNLLMEMYNSPTLEEREKAKRRYELRKKNLLLERDEYIASRISNTLKTAETGVLFIGAEHNVIPFIAKDIEIIDLVKR
ncbi:hypothetical protein ASJ81_11230 [Methanosarcina spelaei]|uniref:Uncharacterized protein n=1 Tax=Methanosarcina spelaei TaxID=1036679 RepID=A0A2A2HPD4_9EURY|nr:hypothetical protein [Methanosarcina spelaei]PAV11222.1 hypothetical protein ASJ81_11230 [Methanosarcina spelaei]